MEYNILVDYDNLTVFQRNKGLLFNIESILAKMTLSETTYKNIKVRLYGGWYENSNLSKLAQNLTTEIQAVFPNTVELKDKTKVIVNAELANSLIIRPGVLLYHTYRKKGIPMGLGCEHPIKEGCLETACPGICVYNFIKDDKCTKCNHVKPEQLLYRSEQKLVDSMLTADMIYLANSGQDICLVSSDDDFWPGILTAVTIGVKVTQFHTKGNTTNPIYLNTISSNYIQNSL